jgi:hypothetical protein
MVSRGQGGTMSGGAVGGREGMALALILLLLLALTALGHGVLLLSTRELQATWAFRHAVRAGEAAEAGALLAMHGGSALPAEREVWTVYPLVSGETSDGVTYGAELRWLDRELFLLEGMGGSRGWAGERRMGWVGWSLDPRSRLGAFGAGAETGRGASLVGEARIESGPFGDPPEGWPGSSCLPYVEVLDSIFPGGGLPAPGILREPLSPLAEEGDTIPSLGLLWGAEMLARAASATGPGPEPPDSVQGCPDIGEAPVFLGTPGSLHLDRGRLCGLLVVGGDLRLSGQARFQGLALVGGDLTLEEEAVLEGMMRVGSRLLLGGSALFRSAPCPVLRAMEELPVLADPVPVPGGHRIKGF